MLLNAARAIGRHQSILRSWAHAMLPAKPLLETCNLLSPPHSSKHCLSYFVLMPVVPRVCSKFSTLPGSPKHSPRCLHLHTDPALIWAPRHQANRKVTTEPWMQAFSPLTRLSPSPVLCAALAQPTSWDSLGTIPQRGQSPLPPQCLPPSLVENWGISLFAFDLGKGYEFRPNS